jgi:hypothetical protein
VDRCRSLVDCHATAHETGCPSQLTDQPLRQLARDVENLRAESARHRERILKLERYVLALAAVAGLLAVARFDWL